MSHVDFISNSNRKARQQSKRWCENHPTSLWAEGYKQCAVGWRLGEECKEGSKE